MTQAFTKKQAVEILKFQGFDEKQIAVVTDNWDMLLPMHDNMSAGMVFNLINEHARVKNKIPELKTLLEQDLILQIGKLKLLSGVISAVKEKRKHQCITVNGHYTYTVGVSIIHDVDVEFVICNGTVLGGMLLNEIIARFTREPDITLNEIFTSNNCYIGKEPMRMLLQACPSTTTTDEVPCYRNTYIPAELVKSGAQVVQLFLGDRNNILPGEVGYDASYVQVIEFNS